jgi:hypothetical protein
MKLSQDYKDDKMVEQGRAVARGMEEIRLQKEKNMVKAVKRRQTMLEHAAEKELFKS